MRAFAEPFGEVEKKSKFGDLAWVSDTPPGVSRPVEERGPAEAERELALPIGEMRSWSVDMPDGGERRRAGKEGSEGKLAPEPEW